MNGRTSDEVWGTARIENSGGVSLEIHRTAAEFLLGPGAGQPRRRRRGFFPDLVRQFVVRRGLMES